MSNSELLYFIINTISPYAYEINNILALPERFQYRVRYKEKWIHGSIVKRIRENKFLDGNSQSRALIVLRDFSSGWFLPVRYVKVVGVSKFGNIYYFKYSLGELYKYSWPDNNISKLEDFEILRGIKEDIEQNIKNRVNRVVNEPNQDLSPLVFMGRDLVYKEEELEEDEAWANIVSLLKLVRKHRNSDEFVYRDFDFIRITGLHRRNGKDIGTLIEDKLIKDNSIVLKPGTILTLSILQRTYTGESGTGDSSVKERRRIELRAKPNIIEVNPSIKNITGKYEWSDFYLNANYSGIRDNYGILFLDVNNRDFAKSTHIEIPLIIKPNTEKTVIGVIFSIIGIYLMFSAEGLLYNLGIIFVIIGGTILDIKADDIFSLLKSALGRG